LLKITEILKKTLSHPFPFTKSLENPLGPFLKRKKTDFIEFLKINVKENPFKIQKFH
jgi:hypothetical protein